MTGTVISKWITHTRVQQESLPDSLRRFLPRGPQDEPSQQHRKQKQTYCKPTTKYTDVNVWCFIITIESHVVCPVLSSVDCQPLLCSCPSFSPEHSPILHPSPAFHCCNLQDEPPIIQSKNGRGKLQSNWILLGRKRTGIFFLFPSRWRIIMSC